MTVPLSLSRTSTIQSSTFSSSSSSSQSAAAGQRDNNCISSASSTNSSHNGQQTTSAAPERTMGLMSAILMIVGTLIGTGIFASPGPLFDSVNCSQTSFIIWAFAGVVCTIGAFAYAELGTMFPESGGDFQYLARAYGKKVALVFGWSFITILNPIGTAGIAGVLGRYSVDTITYLKTGTSAGIGGAGAYDPHYPLNATGAGSILNGTGYYVPHAHSPYAPGTPAYDSFPKDGAPIPGHTDEMPWVVRAFSISAILLMGLINILFKEGGKYASNILAIFKIAGMFMLIVIGSIQAVKNHAKSEALSIPIAESSQNVLDYVSALCFAFFAYNGFNNINLGLGELRDPEKNLKRAVWIAMPFVTILFLLANFAFFSILSSYDLRHVHSLSLHAGHTVLGQPGGFLMAGTVIASALGSINANIWAGSRLLVIMAKDNAIVPSPIAKPWLRTGTQATAIIILIGQASVHALINLDFKTFSKIYSAVGWSWYGLSILGLLYLRRTKPAFPRPVKVFWPLAAGFVMVAFFLVFGSLTLAFMSSSQQDDEGEDGGAGGGGGGGRFTSVILFGMAILLMLGVIPAFYLTRCFNRRRGVKQGSATEISGSGVGSGSEDTEPSNDSDRNTREDGQGFHGNFISRAMEDKAGTENDEKPSRRHSGASSVTLVGESKRKNRQARRSHCEQDSQPHHHESGQQGSSFTNSREQQQTDDDESDEEVISRVQTLRSARLQSREGLDDPEMGTYSNREENSFSPAGPFPQTCMSPTSTGTRGSGFNSPCGPPQFLDLPCNDRSGSRSSETTLGLEGECMYDKEQVCTNAEKQGNSRMTDQDRPQIEEQHTDLRPYVLNIPLTSDGPLPASRAASSFSSNLQSEDEQRIHPLAQPRNNYPPTSSS